MIQQPKWANDPSHYYRPTSYEALTVDATVRTPTIPQGTRMAKVYFRTGPVRITWHGVNPTSSLGVPMYDGYEEFYSVVELAAMRLIREGTDNAEVHFVYYQ